MRTITIKPALNGYVCTVGCQTVVFNSRHVLCEALEKYLAHPNRVEVEYLKNAVNPPVDVTVPAVANPAQEACQPQMNENPICPDDGQRVATRTNFGGPEPCPVPDRPQTMRERALAGTLPAGTPPLSSLNP